MAETLPMLERDPRASYKISRQMRIVAFSLVASIVLVSVLIVFVRYVWDRFIAEAFGMAPYDSNPLLVVPAMLIITAFLAKMFWDGAEGRDARRK